MLNDGDYRDPGHCIPTASSSEGPFYISNAPERSNLDIFGDNGVALRLSGTIFEYSCQEPLPGAVVEIWHADPQGLYDNSTSALRYRCTITSNSDGKYQLSTLLPGRYLNEETYRPRHLHVKVFDSEGQERLTTQLYFAGDPYIECDSLAKQSLVLTFEGDESSGMVVDGADFVLT